MPELFCAAGVELAQHELVQHRGLEQRLFVAKSFPDEDEGHDDLAARVEPEGVEGVQRLLGGLMERQERRAELSATWTDILNQRKSLQRSASSSGFYESYAEQLRSYFLISLRYKFNRMN